MTVYFEVSASLRPITPAALERFVETYVALEHDDLVGAGFELVGAWRRVGGSVNTVLQLYRFESLAAWADARSRLRQLPDFRERHRRAWSWLDAGSFQERIRLGEGLPQFDPPDAPAGARAQTGSPPYHDVQMVLGVKIGEQAEAYEALRSSLEHEQQTWHPLAVYEAITGLRGELTAICRLAEGETNKLLDPLRTPLDARLATPAPNQRLYLLLPLPHSPLA